MIRGEAPEDQNRVQPFRDTPSALTVKPPRTSTDGAAVSQSLLERHNPTVTITSERHDTQEAALADLLGGARRWYIWHRMGWQDMRLRYRRSVIGPFWLSISMGVMILALGILYSGLFKIDIKSYMPFLAAGLVIWGMISASLIEGCSVFIDAEGLIKNVNLPLSIYIYRVLWRNIIIFAHNLVVYIATAAWFGINPGLGGFMLLPGLFLFVLNAIWMMLFMGIISARFRDVPPIINSLIQVLFFFTPVIWRPELAGDRAGLVHFNPFSHLIDIMRGPMLGEMPSWESWAVCIGMAVIGWAVTLRLYARLRWRITYWM
jgi:ABC-type polysaccharide/polyol phosphate export permease